MVHRPTCRADKRSVIRHCSMLESWRVTPGFCRNHPPYGRSELPAPIRLVEAFPVFLGGFGPGFAAAERAVFRNHAGGHSMAPCSTRRTPRCADRPSRRCKRPDRARPARVSGRHRGRSPAARPQLSPRGLEPERGSPGSFGRARRCSCPNNPEHRRRLPMVQPYSGETGASISQIARHSEFEGKQPLY